jgi:hypothetical protein
VNKMKRIESFTINTALIKRILDLVVLFIPVAYKMTRCETSDFSCTEGCALYDHH